MDVCFGGGGYFRGSCFVLESPGEIIMGRPFFLTKERRHFFLRRVVLPVLMVHVSLCVAATANNTLVKRDTRAAILISDYAITKYDYWASPLAFIGAYPYWTYYFNNRGMTVRWFLRVESTDLEKVIKDAKFQSIARQL